MQCVTIDGSVDCLLIRNQLSSKINVALQGNLDLKALIEIDTNNNKETV